jgi:thiol-disulfide isomerase/thioredoxin
LSRRLALVLVLVVVLGGGSGVLLFTQEGKEKTNENPAIQMGQDPNEVKTKEAPKEGFLAPQFSLYDLSGNQVSLSDFRGRVVLLNFWATWCAPCRREIPSLERLYHMRKGEGFEIVAVNSERASSSKIASFVQQYQMSFPILLNPGQDVGSRYWIRAVPTSFLVDKKGVIRWKIVGGREWESAYVLSRIDQLLQE